MAHNPFQYLRPVAPQNFVGRQSLVNDIVSDLTIGNGDSHAIIAGRRCGKTSVLKALAYQLSQPITAESSEFRLLPLHFDFRSEPFQSAGAFFAHMLREVRRRIDRAVCRRPQADWPSPIHLDEAWFQDLANRDELALHEFEKALGYIFDLVATSMQPARLVFLLDEMDTTVDHGWTEVLYGQLRALVHSGELSEQISLVLAGSSRFLMTNERGSPLWNVLKLHYLHTFDKAETEHIISQAEGLPQDAADAVWQQSGGHPFLAQYLLHRLWEEGAANANSAAVEELANRFQIEQLGDLGGWIQAIGPLGQQVYHALISTSDWMDESTLAQAVNSSAFEIKQGLIALLYHGLAIHDGSWRRYKRTGDLFKNLFSALPPETPPKPPIIFLSYSHNDEDKKDRLVKHLRGPERTGLFELWVDDQIKGGADWEQEIKSAMAEASIAILLISAEFLDSDFILGHEVPGFLERRKVDGLKVFPVIAQDCLWEVHSWLRQMNVRPRNRKPIWRAESNDNQIAETLTGIAREIVAIVEKQTGQSA